MAVVWNSVLFVLPNNNDIVWIRVLNIYGEPVLAQYKAAKQEFTTQTTSVVLPASFVARWRVQ